MRQFFRQHYTLQLAQQKSQLSEGQTALRLQAYERLTLLAERSAIPELILRLQNKEITASHLQNAMMIAVQKEYEHNLTQQIYVSTQLWRMITLFKDETLGAITAAYARLEAEDKNAYLQELYNTEAASIGPMRRKVTDAIRKEVELYFL